MPWTFPFPCLGPAKMQTNFADKSADKVCLNLCLTNFIKNADACAGILHQNADKLCLREFVCRNKVFRQSLSILDLALQSSAGLVPHEHHRTEARSCRSRSGGARMRRRRRDWAACLPWLRFEHAPELLVREGTLRLAQKTAALAPLY